MGQQENRNLVGEGEETPSPAELLAINGFLQRRIKALEAGVMQEYIDSAGKVVEGFCQMVVDAQNGNATADARVKKFLDALRLAQGKTVKLPRVLHKPDGSVMMVEPEDNDEAIPDALAADWPGEKEATS